MLTDQELQALMADLESDRVERKAALSDKNEIRRAICAFANDLPDNRYNGRVWVRVAPRRAQATAEEERRLTEKRRAGDLPFDQHPILNVAPEDLDWERFRRDYLPLAVAPEVLVENQRTPEEQFASLHFLDRAKIPKERQSATGI